jgi:hypothetical protein
MKALPENPLLFRYVCPKCATAFETKTFRNEYPKNWLWKGARARLTCPNCKASLRIREKFYFYLNLFAFYVCLVIVGGFTATFFVEEKMHVTFAMLGAMTLSIPLMVLVAINNKAEYVGENT